MGINQKRDERILRLGIQGRNSLKYLAEGKCIKVTLHSDNTSLLVVPVDG